MDCEECKKAIDGTYFEVDGGKSVCAKCYEENHQKKCSDCKNPIEGTYYTVSDNFMCGKCYKKKHGDSDGKVTCNECKKEVKGQIIRAVGFAYHKDCFKCFECKRDLSTKQVQFTTDKENRLYCQDDYNTKYAPRCFACELPIAPKDGETTAQRLTAFDKDWHPECFKCADCKEVLNSKEGKKCYPIETTPLCLECNQKRG